MSNQKLNIQYSSRELLDSVYRCKVCRSSLLMFGCANDDCKNSQKNYFKKSDKQPK